MSTTVTISDALAEALEALRRRMGAPTLDAAAESLIGAALAQDDADRDELGLTQKELRAKVLEGEQSGDPTPWDASAIRAGARARPAALRRG